MSKRTQLGSVVTTTTSGQYYLMFMLDVIFIWLAIVKKPLRIARASSSYEHSTCRLHLKRQCSMYEKPESSGPDMTMLYNESPPFLSTPNATGNYTHDQPLTNKPSTVDPSPPVSEGEPQH